MVALLMVRFRATNTVPENENAFFEDLFDVLLRRHDRMKAGYVRPRSSRLGDRDLQAVFEATCYFMRRDGVLRGPSHYFLDTVDKAIRACQQAADCAKVLKDISTITCLILEDGLDYVFIHKNVQEFFCANFIRKQPDEIAVRFYEAMRSKWPRWNEEVGFLSTLDQYRFFKHFFIPIRSELLAHDVQGGRISSELIARLIGQLEVVRFVGDEEQPIPPGVRVIYDPLVYGLGLTWLNPHLLQALMDVASRKASAKQAISMADILGSDPALKSELRDNVARLLPTLRAELNEARSFVEKVEANADIFEI